MPIIDRTRRGITPSRQLDAKRADRRDAREANRTKYTMLYKDKSPEEYKGIKLIVDGKEVEVSPSAKFLLEQMIHDDEEKEEK